MLVFSADLTAIQGPHRKGLVRELTLLPYVKVMSSAGHDEANRQMFLVQDAENSTLVGLALRGPKKAVDKVIKELALHS